MVLVRYGELRLAVGARNVGGRPALTIEAAGAKTLRIGGVDEDIRRGVPRYIIALLGSRFREAQVLGVEIGRAARAPAGRIARLEAAETAGHAAGEGILELVVARAGRDRKHFRNDIEVHRPEERGLFDLALGILEEGDIVVLHARVFGGGQRVRTDIRQAAGVPGRAGCAIRRTCRNALVRPVGLVEQLVLFIERTDDAADTPVVGSA